jgi:glycosyltransferase involved in cell wall biosynthesis
MIAYTHYRVDARVMREAETLVAQNQYDVLVIVPKQGNQAITYELQGVTIQELNTRQYRGKSKSRYVLSYLKFMLLSFLACNKLILKRRVDIFHVHNMPNFLVFSAILARGCGKTLILDIHDSVPEMFATKFSGRSNNLMFWLLCREEAISSKLAHHVICVNHPQRDILVSRGLPAGKMAVSLNVPDPKRWKRTRLPAGEEHGAKPFTLVYHGTVAKRLGVDIAIEAVGKLVYLIPNMKFRIYGEGDDRDDCIRLIKSLGLQDTIDFYDFLPFDELLPVIENTSLGLVGNRRSLATELMLPVKLLEYVALDIPVVAPRLRAIQHYFSDEMVSYFEPDDSDSMSSAILEIYQNQGRRDRQVRAARRFLDRFGWETHQSDFLALYNRL